MDYTKYINKVVKITTKKDYYYTGRLKEIDEDSILILDKFGKDVIIKIYDIKTMVG